MFINIPLKGSAFTVCGKFILMGDFHWSVKGQYRGKTLGFADSGQYPVFSGGLWGVVRVVGWVSKSA